MRKGISILLAVVLFLSAFMIPSAQAAVQKVDYVALGDSIAKGQTPYKEIGTGYTDMIAAELSEQEALKSFTKEYAMSGETSTGFVEKLKRADVQEAVKEAELVTISTGANDVLQLLNSDNFTLETAELALAKMKGNLASGLKTIKSLSPNAKVFVFGYYFPFPNMTDNGNYQLAFSIFNSELQATAQANGAVFVEVSSQFNPEFLPNPADVHPSEDGYRVFADQFFNVWENSPAEDPFSDIGTTGSQARLAIMKLAEAGILNGNPDGTFTPKSNITRAETAIILARALGYGKTTAQPGFSDVSTNMKAYDAIAALTEAGVFAKAPKFNPDKLLTRAQMARVLTQSLKLEASNAVPFSDVPATHWAKDEIEAVVSNGIMNGGSNSRFLPENNMTREQFAMTVYNVWSQTP